jgi:hypothetical protein
MYKKKNRNIEAIGVTEEGRDIQIVKINSDSSGTSYQWLILMGMNIPDQNAKVLI